jgi:outer membrane protein TolC
MVAQRSTLAEGPPASTEILPAPPPQWDPPVVPPPNPMPNPTPGPNTWPGAQGPLQGPLLSQTATPLPVPPARPALSQKPLPINLATALRLSGARPILISAAQASEQVAAAQLEQAQVLWLPNLNIGASYYRHDGGAQGNSGTLFVNGRNQFMAGLGPTAVFSTADAIFAPLAARQVLRSRTFDVQTARNNALLSVADAFFNLQQARGRFAGAQDCAEKARALAKTIEVLAQGLVPLIEVNRARTELAMLEQSVASARGDWGVASADLTRALRLDPTALVLPLEPPHLQVTLISPHENLDDLIPIGLSSRPELASQQALVQAALVKLKQEKVRPLVPSVVLLGDAVPAAPGGYLSTGVYGSGSNGSASPWTTRNDMSIQALWGLNNLGFGNRAIIRERQAEQQQSLVELFRTQDTVAAEVAQAYVQLASAADRVVEAENGVKQAQLSYAGNLQGMSQTTRFGDVLVLVNRPQEVVAALQQLATSYDNYFISVNDFNRAQFRLYHAMGYPARILACDRSPGEIQPIDTSRPFRLPPVQ